MITLRTLQFATRQEVFDQCCNHLLTQMEQSCGKYEDQINGCVSKGCAYRGDGGLKCAAGCFIADSEYTPHMEGDLWGDLINKGYVPDAHADLIAELQFIHDQMGPDEWKSGLRKLAERHGLKFSFGIAVAPVAVV